MTKLGWTLIGLTVIGGVALAIKEASAAPSLEGRGKSLSDFLGDEPRQGRVAIESQLGAPRLRVRSAPKKDAPIVEPNDANAGTIVTVLKTGIHSDDPSVSREWWRIRTPGGAEGFVSAVGPRGEHNLELV